MKDEERPNAEGDPTPRDTRLANGQSLPLDGGGYFPALLESHGGTGSLSAHSPRLAVLASTCTP
jgi:hypothetical protein